MDLFDNQAQRATDMGKDYASEKDCCKPAAGAVAGVVVSAFVLITALIIIIAFCCKCCCFKNKQEVPASV